jgi:predicted RNA-binding Zn-ribbon protein involved in translation (DUF1610 family)
MSSNTPSTERQPSHKATLYCPNCDHASRINGDWLIHVHANHLDYECPECGTTINSRRDSADLTSRSDGAMECCNAD